MTLIATRAIMRKKTAENDEAGKADVMRNEGRSSGGWCHLPVMLSTRRRPPGVLTSKRRSPGARSTNHHSPGALSPRRRRSPSALSPGRLSPDARSTKHQLSPSGAWFSRRCLPGARSTSHHSPAVLSPRRRSPGALSTRRCSPDTKTQRRLAIPFPLFGTIHTNWQCYGCREAKRQLLAPSSKLGAGEAHSASRPSSTTAASSASGRHAASAASRPAATRDGSLLRSEEETEEMETACFAPQPPPEPMRLVLVKGAPHLLASSQVASVLEIEHTEGEEPRDELRPVDDVALSSRSGVWDCASQCWSAPHRSACRNVATQAQPDLKTRSNCGFQSYRPMQQVADGGGARYTGGEGRGAGGGAWLGGARALRDSHVRLVVRQLRLISRLNRALDRAAPPQGPAPDALPTY